MAPQMIRRWISVVPSKRVSIEDSRARSRVRGMSEAELCHDVLRLTPRTVPVPFGTTKREIVTQHRGCGRRRPDAVARRAPRMTTEKTGLDTWTRSWLAASVVFGAGLVLAAFTVPSYAGSPSKTLVHVNGDKVALIIAVPLLGAHRHFEHRVASPLRSQRSGHPHVGDHRRAQRSRGAGSRDR